MLELNEDIQDSDNIQNEITSPLSMVSQLKRVGHFTYTTVCIDNHV